MGENRELIKRDAKVDAARTTDGWTALMWASQNGHLEVVRDLCKKSANVNAASTVSGVTALMNACIKGHVTIARFLITQGSKKDTLSNSGKTALDYFNSFAMSFRTELS